MTVNVDLYKPRHIAVTLAQLQALNDTSLVMKYDKNIHPAWFLHELPKSELDKLDRTMRWYSISDEVPIIMSVAFPKFYRNNKPTAAYMRTYWIAMLKDRVTNVTYQLAEEDFCIDIPMDIYLSLDDVPEGKEFDNIESIELDKVQLEQDVEEAIKLILEEE